MFSEFSLRAATAQTDRISEYNEMCPYFWKAEQAKKVFYMK